MNVVDSEPLCVYRLGDISHILVVSNVFLGPGFLKYFILIFGFYVSSYSECNIIWLKIFFCFGGFGGL